MRVREFVQPSKEEIQMRKQMYAEAEALGIDLMGFDGNDKSDEARRDRRKAVVLLGTGKSVPDDLKNRLLKQKITVTVQK